jgi:LAO/AO transport system kinase
MSFEERILARMATGVENRDPHALAIVDTLQPGHARILGITGPPGAGKSTLVSALASAIRRQGKTLAILAVDPTSGISGGAILGDRIRMQQHHDDPGIFIRSMATRGSLGGLARATADMVRLMDAAGKDYVVIETVGVGQAEIAIAGLAQVTVVVLVPGMGDDVQAIKAGILEIADVFAINKSDQPGADRVKQELEAMLSLAHGRNPAIVKTVATTGEGIADLLDAIQAVPPANRALAATHIELHVTNLNDAVARLQSAGARIESGAEGHILVVPPAGVLLELIEERNQPTANS